MTNLRSKLSNFELTDAQKGVETIWLTPNDTISTLSVYMDMYEVRHIPIMESKSGPLLGVLSLGDCLQVQTPPEQELPMERLIKSEDFKLKDLYNEVDQTGCKKICEVFHEYINKERKIVTVSEDDTLEDAFKKLIDKDENNRRYRTLPITKKNYAGVTGMLSYTDLLRLIREPNQNNQSFLNLKINNSVMNTQVKTLGSMRTLTDAINMFKRTPFRHIPLTVTGKEGDENIVGIVDDVIIKTFQHRLLIKCLRDMPLGEIATLSGKAGTIGNHNTVNPDDDIKTLIGNFVDEGEKPTAILAGSPDQSTFIMKGIISYVDIFRKFLETTNTNASLDI